MTLHQTVPVALNSPYRTNYVSVDRGLLSVLIDDPSVSDADFRKAKLVNATLITDEGKEIVLPLSSTNYGIGVTFFFNLKAVGFDDDHFGLRITISLAGKTTTISGQFAVHSHIEIIDVPEALDHG